MSRDDDGIPVEVSLTHDSSGAIGRVGNYVIEAKLGQGGFGAVYRAHHAETENVVALKLLRADIAQRLPDVVLRFQREAKASNKINHRGVAKVLDFGVAGGQFFLTMELLEGVALDAEVKRNGAMSMRRALPILIQIAEALGAAHARGYVHRDVKPPNVFLIDDPHPDFVKVLDFGIAKILTPDADDPLHTGTHAMMGSPTTMAPEQWKGADIDHRADIYALGVLSFYLLTGHYPFSGTQGELIAKHQLLPPPKVSEILANSTPQLDAAIDRALLKRPEERFQTMEEFRDALAECAIAAGARPVAQVARIPPPVARPVAASPFTPTMNGESRSALSPRSKAGLLAAIAAGVVALGAGGAWFAHRPAKAPAPIPPAHAVPPPAPPARAHVTSVPSGATVSIEDRILGATPLDVDGKPGVRLRLHLVRDRYQPADEEVTPADPPASLEVELRPLVAEPAAPAPHGRHGKSKSPMADAPARGPAGKKPGSADATANPFEGSP